MFYDQLKSWRRQQGYTIREVSERSGVSAAYISQLENGRRGIPSPDILQKLSDGLQVPYEALMEEAGYMRKERPDEGRAPEELTRLLRERPVTFEGVGLTERDKEWVIRSVRDMLWKEERLPARNAENKKNQN